MLDRVRFIVQTLRAQLAQFPALTALGVVGLALGGVCAAAGLILGADVPPEGNWFDTATFDAALGVFILTMAALAPGVSWTARGRRTWTGALLGLTTYSYGIETLQAFRGLDPRFSRVAAPLDQAAGGIFFLVALAVMVCFIVLAVKYLRAPVDPFSLAVRYGAAASFVAFGVGIWMSLITQGRFVPEAGNLLILHAAGFHGLQAVPLVALLLRWAHAPEAIGRPRVHKAGLAWLGGCVALAWQSFSGLAVAVVSAATMTAVVCLLAFTTIAVGALREWLNTQDFDGRDDQPATPRHATA